MQFGWICQIYNAITHDVSTCRNARFIKTFVMLDLILIQKIYSKFIRLQIKSKLVS